LHVVFLAESIPITATGWCTRADRFSYQVLPILEREDSRAQTSLLNRGVKDEAAGAAPDPIRAGLTIYPASLARRMWWAGRNQVPVILWVEEPRIGFSQWQPNHGIPETKIHESFASAFRRPRQVIVTYANELRGRARGISLPRPTRLTQIFFARGRRCPPGSRDARQALQLPRVFSCSWAGWSRKKECLTCLRPMAN